MVLTPPAFINGRRIVSFEASSCFEFLDKFEYLLEIGANPKIPDINISKKYSALCRCSAAWGLFTDQMPPILYFDQLVIAPTSCADLSSY